MSKKIKTLKLKVNYLILVGTDKNYCVPFDTGLNIIYGDSDTGKSSILNLINYCLGSSTLDTYDEIELKGQYCLLDVSLLGTQYTIKRDIFNPTEDIEVYHGSYTEIENSFPKYYSASYRTQAEDGVFSEFLLKAMRIPLIKVKQAPTKEDTNMINLSFRDIFKYNYLDQDKIGSKKLFGENYARLVKLKETFKLMHNVLDSQITELDGQISNLIKEKNQLVIKNKSISSFLKETEVNSLQELTLEREILENNLIELKEEIKNIDTDIINSNENLVIFRLKVNEIEILLRSLNEKLQTNQLEIKQNISLRNEYKNDEKKIKATIEAIEKFPKFGDKRLNCPLCDSKVNVSVLIEHFSNSDIVSVKGELNSLRRRMRNLDTIYKKLKEDERDISKQIKHSEKDYEEALGILDKFSIEMITPYLSRRDILSLEIGKTSSNLEHIKHFYKIRFQQSINQSDISDIEDTITELKNKLTSLKDDAPSLDNVLKILGKKVKEILRFIGIKNPTDISISNKTFLPIIRGRDYETITSGGVRTVSSVAYYLSLMIYATENPVNYPSFLMIDTLTKYLGKNSVKEKYASFTNRDQDKIEGMTDSEKNTNIYKYLLSLNSFKNSFQLIIVDNDIPEELHDDLQPYIRKYFSPKDPGSEVGFINDIVLNRKDHESQFDLFENDEERFRDVDFDN